jgi:hypothetical protein
VATPPARGLGTDIALIKLIMGDDTEALNLLDQALQNPPSVHTADNIVNGIPDEVEDRLQGNSI